MILAACLLLALPRPAPADTWWSLRPISAPPIPKFKPSAPTETAWTAHPIDRFVLNKMRSKGLHPNLPADRRTLIRRATFDLHGVPPTPQEINAFVVDRRPDAWKRVIDRLLASPRYGERWGRHWLDIVHYADTHGYDKDKRRDDAWPYRDYVIRSLNQDKPYDTFIKEQIAGDVLFPGQPDGIIATGFIAAGPWDFVGNVELREGTVEKEKTRVLDRDDMVSNAIATFCSVTIHCARCHDHKFDPIPQRDYYRLQAVFAGVERGVREFSDATTYGQRIDLTRRLEDGRKRLEDYHQRIARLSSPAVDALSSRIEVLQSALVDSPTESTSAPKPSPTNGYHSGIEAQPDVTKWVQVDLGKSVPIQAIVLFPARPTDFPDTPGFGFPLRYRVEVSDSEEMTGAIVVEDRSLSDVSNPGLRAALIEPKQVYGRYVRVTALSLWKRTGDFVFALGELQVIADGKNAAAGAKVSARDSIEAGRWSVRHLVDGFDSRSALADLSEPRAAESFLRKLTLQRELDEAEREREKARAALVSPETRAEMMGLQFQMRAIEAELGSLPPPSKVYAALPREPRPIWVLARGEVEQRGEPVRGGALSCVPGLPSVFDEPAKPQEGARRAALAEWIAHPKNPLTWRSIVNRVWQYHFGKGLVETPSDFGKNGSLPTHPELLDWLSDKFRSTSGGLGQSLKSLHRLIMTSQAYQQSSQSDSRQAKLDADNRFLWRANRQRLEAEAIRDSVLAVSGGMDWRMGGPGFEMFRFKDDHSPTYDHSDLDRINDPKNWRRTIYRFTVRSVPSPFLASLDCADPNANTPVRNVTLTPLQALELLNDPFMVRQAEVMAGRLSREKRDVGGQVGLAYRLALGREPSKLELARAAGLVNRHGLANFCRLLLNSNEFMFVD